MIIKPYGDTLNDGAVQLSFTLPVENSAKAEEAARLFVKKLGFEECEIVHSNKLSDNFTFFVAYGKTKVGIDYDSVEVQEVEKSMDFYQVNDFVKEQIKRKVVIIGACTGSDAHTVGIDAIMNMKGFAGHYGLERYRNIDAYNMGSQVENSDLIKKALEVNADVLLISQTVTQKDVHIKNLVNLVELLEAEHLRNRFIVIVGGPRITHELSKELGFDAGFGPKKFAEDVASYFSQELIHRIKVDL